MKLLILIILTVLGGVLYRCGGAGKTGKWYDFILNTKARDFGIPLLMLLFMYTAGLWHWTLLPSALLLFGALTYYWKDHGQDAKWYNWLLTGIFYSMAMWPYVFHSLFSGGDLNNNIVTAFWVRSLMLSYITMEWSELMDNAVFEEFGRGFFIMLTLFFFLL